MIKMKTFIRRYIPEIASDMEEELKENNISVFEWIKNYENTGYFGLSAILVDIIGKEENLEHLTADDSISNSCIYLPANYPWCFNSVEKLLTPNNMEYLFRKYLSQITDDPIVCENLTLHIESLD